jgi:hypothetical protein
VLAATVKVGGRNFVQVEVLQAIKTHLDHLPAKQKTMLEFRDAAVFLYPCIKGAVQKNYTKDEILQIIIKEGWEITQNSFRYLWSLFLSEDENPSKKKSHVRSAGKTKAEKSNSAIEGNKNNAPESLETISVPVADKENDETNEASLSPEILTSSKNNAASDKNDTDTQPQSSAHFELSPDTEDL